MMTTNARNSLWVGSFSQMVFIRIFHWSPSVVAWAIGSNMLFKRFSLGLRTALVRPLNSVNGSTDSNRLAAFICVYLRLAENEFRCGAIVYGTT